MLALNVVTHLNLHFIWVAAYHAVIYALVAGAILLAAYYVLDLLTPGHLGDHLLGNGALAVGARRGGVSSTDSRYGSGSGGLVASAWMLGNGAVLFTAIWTNGSTSLGWPLVWTVAMGLVGIIVNSIMLVAIDLATPGNLREIITLPGTPVPLALLTAAAVLAVSAIVCASIA